MNSGSFHELCNFTTPHAITLRFLIIWGVGALWQPLCTLSLPIPSCKRPVSKAAQCIGRSGASYNLFCSCVACFLIACGLPVDHLAVYCKDNIPFRRPNRKIGLCGFCIVLLSRSIFIEDKSIMAGKQK